MTRPLFKPSQTDMHIAHRMQLRRQMLGMTQADLARKCGITFQQIQKYEAGDNKVNAARLFDISRALETPVSFFYSGLPGNLHPEPRRRRFCVASPGAKIPSNVIDPIEKTESLKIMNMYWRLSSDEQRKMVTQILEELTGDSTTTY